MDDKSSRGFPQFYACRLTRKSRWDREGGRREEGGGRREEGGGRREGGGGRGEEGGGRPGGGGGRCNWRNQWLRQWPFSSLFVQCIPG